MHQIFEGEPWPETKSQKPQNVAKGPLYKMFFFNEFPTNP